ncbi:MAG: hypothetical protein IJN57_06105 [Oscillospiraceae bacterium]|nr:hypothetical protein [Oscillospiraceae bacterium]
MKKRIYVLALIMLLCGCGSQQVPPEETVLTTTQPEKIVETQDTETTPLETVLEVDLNTTTKYGDFEGFLKSDFCKEMRENGYAPYAISYDEERYELKGVTADGCFYSMGFRNKQGGKGVYCAISFGSYETVDDLTANVWDTSGDSFATVDKNGVSYDVYIAKTPYIDYDVYAISYIPFSGYKMYIHADASTPEEALAYIHEFDLVPVTAEGEIAETTAAQETETTPEETAAPAETEATETEPTPETIPETTPETNENPPAETPAEPE